MRQLVLGIDIGATKILCGLLDWEGQVLAEERMPTNSGQEAPGDTLDRIARQTERMLLAWGVQVSDLNGIAVACPGPISYPEGVVLDSPNLGWHNLNLRQELKTRFNREVLVGKDTDLAALGEYHFGQGEKVRHLLYMTVSTGIGGGIISDGNLYRGIAGGAGEFGHMVIETGGRRCRCGRRGCLEALASGTAIAEQARELLERGPGSRLREYSLPGQSLTAREIGAAARAGEREAQQMIERTAVYLATGIANLINIFNPGKVVLGGGMLLGLQDLLLEPIWKMVRAGVFALHRESLKLEITSLGNNIGLYGCLALLKYGVKNEPVK